MIAREYEFEVDVTDEDAKEFAKISGDWNPLHTNSDYAAKTIYRRPILHGAYSSGLVSRMAGMHIPGRDCLLHGIKLKFISPIYLPARLKVRGKLLREADGDGAVEVTISDIHTGVRYVDGSYEFGRHHYEEVIDNPSLVFPSESDGLILVTGASGSLGRAVIECLGSAAIGVTRSRDTGALIVNDLMEIEQILGNKKIAAIVHCGWPSMDNQGLIGLGNDVDAAVEYNLAKPISDCIKLAQLLASNGVPDASLLLIGSTAAYPGRHNWRMPLYSLAKSLIPTLVKILAVELGSRKMRSIGVVFDVIDGGMNAGMRDAVRLGHADRLPSGELPSPKDAANQIAWVLGNTSSMISGALVDFSGAAIP
jgi:acyl dehydratase/NAD(P)-dependent dehydrogenase (short-subunit alcohol dehydrogenase family)